MRIVSALATAFAILGAVPAVAQIGYYAATPAEKLTKTSLVTRSTLWKCADGTCVASKGGDRDAVVCQLVAQRVGTLTAFTANGAAFDPDALAKCNARAH